MAETELNIEVETSREPLYDGNHGGKNDQIGGWRGEPPMPKVDREERPTDDPPVIEIQTSRRWSIIRVPSHVREVDEKAYTPKILSIGPFHHGASGVKAMVAHKLRFLKRLQERFASRDVLKDLEDAMRNLEESVRGQYSEEFEHVESDDFVKMLVLDACFIVELLRLHGQTCKQTPEKSIDVKEQIFGTRWMLPIIGRDLLMLENQIPMFVLEKTYDLTKSIGDIQTPLDKLALQFFEPLRPYQDKSPTGTAKNQTKGVTYPHLLGLFQSSFVPNTVESSSEGDIPRRKWSDYGRLPGKGWVNNATRLSYAGISFCSKTGDRILSVELRGNELKIPTLLIDDGMSSLLRNLLAYEQSDRYAAPYFTCLAMFLDSIVDTAKDIDILRNAGIIKQAKGGNDEVVDLLNSLTRGLDFEMEDCYLREQVEEINDFCRSFSARARVYFKTWRPPIGFLSLFLSYISVLQTLLYFVNSPFQQNNDSTAPAPASSPAPS